MSEKENREISEEEFKDALKDIVNDTSEQLDFFAGMDRAKPDAARFLVNDAAGDSGLTRIGNATGDAADANCIGDTDETVKRRTFTRISKRKKIGFALSTACVVLLCAGVVISGIFSVNGPTGDELNTNIDFGGADSLHYMRGDAGYGNIYKAIEKLGSQNYRDDLIYALEEIEAPVNSPDSNGMPGQESGPELPLHAGSLSVETPEYSDTNIQTEGVQEADLVKTDGKYIYTINSESLCIIEANDGNPELLSKISQPENIASNSAYAGYSQVYFDMYILKDRLVALRQDTNGVVMYDSGVTDVETNESIRYPGAVLHADTSVDIFDISDPRNPKLSHTLSQSGAYTDSRMIGDHLYLISDFSDFDLEALDENDPRSFVPLFAENGKQLTCTPEEIAMSPDYDTLSYTVVSGIDTQTGNFVSKESIFGSNNTVYAGPDNIWLMASRVTDRIEDHGEYTSYSYSDNTLITRVQASDGKVGIAASVQIPGAVLNQFSLDEKDAVLRVVVTDNRWSYSYENYNYDTSISDPDYESSRSNALYTLDMNLNILGSVTDLAKDEQVYSARFIGDTAYFVTFRRADPLFSVDLSDPAHPRVLGALKIPGFSEYLHPYADGLLFGFGKDADEQTGSVGELKLSMFDDSNPADVTEKHKLIIDGFYNSEASNNHKAILVNAGKRLIAFPADEYYMIYAYDPEKGFERLAQVSIPGTRDGYSWYAGLRGMFIGQVFYVVSPNRVAAFDMNDAYKKIGELSIGENAGPVSPNIVQGRGEIIPLTELNQSP